MVYIKVNYYNRKHMEVYKQGNKGPAVLDIQIKLRSLGYALGPKGVDGYFGIATKRGVLSFQKDQRLDEDGIVGEATWNALLAATYALGDRLLYLRSPFFKGRDVRELQRLLAMLGFRVGRLDGIFGIAADRSVREFQTNLLLPTDGIVGSATLSSLKTLSNIIQSQPRELLPFKLLKPQYSFRPLTGNKVNIKFRSVNLETEPPYKKLSKQISNLLKLAGAKVKLIGIYKNGVIPFSTDDVDFTLGIGFSNLLSKNNIIVSHSEEIYSINVAKMTTESLERIANETCVNQCIPDITSNSIFIEFPSDKQELLKDNETYFQKIAVSITDAITSKLIAEVVYD